MGLYVCHQAHSWLLPSLNSFLKHVCTACMCVCADSNIVIKRHYSIPPCWISETARYVKHSSTACITFYTVPKRIIFRPF